VEVNSKKHEDEKRGYKGHLTSAKKGEEGGEADRLYEF